MAEFLKYSKNIIDFVVECINENKEIKNQKDKLFDLCGLAYSDMCVSIKKQLKDMSTQIDKHLIDKVNDALFDKSGSIEKAKGVFWRGLRKIDDQNKKFDQIVQAFFEVLITAGDRTLHGLNQIEKIDPKIDEHKQMVKNEINELLCGFAAGIDKLLKPYGVTTKLSGQDNWLVSR